MTRLVQLLEMIIDHPLISLFPHTQIGKWVREAMIIAHAKLREESEPENDGA